MENYFSMAINGSKWLFSYLIIIHTMVLITLVSLLESVWLLLFATMIIVTSFIFYCQRYHCLKSGRVITRIERDNKGAWQLFYSGDTIEQELYLKHCMVTPKLVILNFLGTRPWNGKSVTIVADAVDAESFRQLRVHLRNPKTFQQ